MDRKPTALYFTTVVAIEPNLAILGGYLYSEEQEPTFTRPMGVNGGKWGKLPDVPDVVYAMARKPPPPGKPRPTLCMMGRKGTYVEKVSGESAVTTTLERKGAGYILDLRWIGSHLYACGTQNLVQRQEPDGRWLRIDQGTFSPIKEYVDRSLQSLDGADDGEIVAVGSDGSIWLFDGKTWSPQASPSSYPLEVVFRSKSGDYYLGGTKGMVWKGSPSIGWKMIGDPSVSTDRIEDIAEFQGRIYLAAERKLLVTDGGPVREVNIPMEGDKSFEAIDALPSDLWTVGDESVFRFDGRNWTRHVCPDN